MTTPSSSFTYKYNDGGNHAIGRQAVFIKKGAQLKTIIFTTIPEGTPPGRIDLLREYK
jgi:hypothetical protein